MFCCLIHNVPINVAMVLFGLSPPILFDFLPDIQMNQVVAQFFDFQSSSFFFLFSFCFLVDTCGLVHDDAAIFNSS